MMLATEYLVALALLARQIVAALPGFNGTCGPTFATITHITAVTIKSTMMVTRSCYTETITTKHHGSGCPNTSTCGPHPDCIFYETQTITIPPSDACCPTTPTIAVQGPCPTCQKGCFTNTVTQYLTQDGASFAKKDVAPTPSPCTKTVFEASPMVVGPTRTMYALTATSTISVSCGGCALLTSNIGGLGPAVTFTTTVTKSATTTTTAWACL